MIFLYCSSTTTITAAAASHFRKTSFQGLASTSAVVHSSSSSLSRLVSNSVTAAGVSVPVLGTVSVSVPVPEVPVPVPFQESKLNFTGGQQRLPLQQHHHHQQQQQQQRRQFSSVTTTNDGNGNGNDNNGDNKGSKISSSTKLSSSSSVSSSSVSSNNIYTVGVTGFSGLIGTAFQNELLKATTKINGKPVRIIQFVRTTKKNSIVQPVAQEFLNVASFPKSSIKVLPWNPVPTSTRHTEEGVIDVTVLRNLDALVHLSGENIATGETGSLIKPLGIRPWTPYKKSAILESRTQSTANLAQAIADSGNTDCDFIVASGVGIYGNDYFASTDRCNGDDDDDEKLPPPATSFLAGVLRKARTFLPFSSSLDLMRPKAAADESTDTSTTKGFLADVSRAWEASADAARMAGNRVVHLRNAVVLSTNGGALQKLYPVFFLGGGGIVGSGNQYFPFISARDVARAMVHILENNPTTHNSNDGNEHNNNNNLLEGPINLCAPESATNRQFTKAMGKVLRRPTLFPFPAFAVKFIFGEMGEETLLGGTRVVPKKLLDSGFRFQHPTVEDAIRSATQEEHNI